MADKDLLDLTESKLPLDGEAEQQEQWSQKIEDDTTDLRGDQQDRNDIYRKRRDFYSGNQGEYSNITGVLKDTKNKKGHTNQVTNYAGKTVVKISMGLANNPPKFIVTPEDATDDIEVAKAQAVEDFIDDVLRKNKFFKSTYRDGTFIQSEIGDYGIKTYVENEKIKICGQADTGKLMVGWNGELKGFDFVIAENLISPKFAKDRYGIKADEKMLGDIKPDMDINGSHDNVDAWTTSGAKLGSTNLPTGKNKLPKLKQIEYDSDDAYALKIEGKLVQLSFKDDENYPKVKFWTIVHNIPNLPSPWSIADIDYLTDIQVELNENDNRTADHLRVGNVQRYVAYNMEDFDPESIKTTSGQVIFVNDPDGKSRFEPLPTNINNFPDDQYNNRKLNQMYDMGLPKVNYGASGADSGRSKAIDYQSSVDLTAFKRDAWELALTDVFEKIQIFGNFLYGEKVDWFTDEEGNFILREIEFDWADALPISQSDKIVNIANKVNMIGLSMRTALKELGYRNPDAEIAQLKKELQDPDLMIVRSKMWQLSSGLLMANNQAATLAQSNASETPPPAGSPSSPTLTTGHNQEGSSPMASKVGSTVSTAKGVVDQAVQNAQASGQ